MSKSSIDEVAPAQKILSVNESTHDEFYGSLPQPETLRIYEEILPGSAERIISMAQQSLSHNVKIEQRLVEEDVKLRRLGMYLGSATSIVSILLSVLLIMGPSSNISVFFSVGLMCLSYIIIFLVVRRKLKINSERE